MGSASAAPSREFLIPEKKTGIAPEEHEFLYDTSDKLVRAQAKNAQLKLGSHLDSSLKMIQYSNDTIIESDLLGNFRRHSQSKGGFQQGTLAVTGESRLAIENAQEPEQAKPSKSRTAFPRLGMGFPGINLGKEHFC